MQTCEKCGQDSQRIEAVLIENRATQRRRAVICSSCWDVIHPGEWFSLSGDEEETEEVTRVYWECDFCTNIFQARGVRVLVRLSQEPPRTEYIVCAACAAVHTDLQPKPTQEEQAQELEPEAEEASAGPALASSLEAEEAHAGPDTQQSGRQSVAQMVVEKVEAFVTTAVTTATDAYKRLTSDQK
jgi:hypothetical protein